MTTWLPTGSKHLASANSEPSPSRRAARSATSLLRYVLSIFSRARVAASYYEDLKPLSQADLAQKGLTRSDLPRAAFRKLTGQP